MAKQGLKSKQYEVIRLMVFDGLSVPEAAKVVELSARAVYDYFENFIFLQAYNKELDKFQNSMTNIALKKIYELSQSSRESIALKASQDLMDRNGRQAVNKTELNTTGIEINIGTDND